MTFAFLPFYFPAESLSKPTEKLKMLECHGEEEEEEEEEPREVCHLAGGVRLKNLSPPASLKGKVQLGDHGPLPLPPSLWQL